MTLDRYVFRLLLTRTVVSVVVLICLVQVLELFDVTTPILQRGLGLGGIGHYSLLRLPGQFQQVAALSVLVGALFTFTQLARTSEMVVIRATGANIYRILRMMAPVAIGVALVDLVVAAEIAPRTQDALSHWMEITATPSEAKPSKPHWFRLGQELVMVGSGSEDGRTLHNLRIYRRDTDRNLVQEIDAPLATAEAGGWRLHASIVTQVQHDHSDVSAPYDQDWKTPLTAGALQRLVRSGQDVASSAAFGAVSGTGPADRSPGFYRTRLNRTFAEPLGAIVMLLLSAPAALSSLRSDQGMRLFLFGLSSGLLFLVADGLLAALGETSALPPVLAAWSAPVAFTALAVTVLLSAEG
ncbi:MAG TPA: LptF/LptG family permease [Caulobacteraceae bacterium]